MVYDWRGDHRFRLISVLPPLSGSSASTPHAPPPTACGTMLVVNEASASDLVAKYGSAPCEIDPTTKFSEVSGNVGIGTTSPGTLLDLQGGGIFRLGGSASPGWPTTGVGLEEAYNTDGQAGSTTGGSGVGLVQAYNHTGTPAWKDLWFRGINTEFDVNGTTAVMYLASTGNVGIGFGGPTGTLFSAYPPTSLLDLEGGGVLRVGGKTTPVYPSAGVGLEEAYDTDGKAGNVSGGSGVGLVQTYDRGTGAWHDLWFRGENTEFDVYNGTAETAGMFLSSAGVSIQGPSPWIDVTAYGADPTGTNDSATDINNAILACPVPVSGAPATGCTVFFPPGSYKVMSAVNVSENSTSTQLQNVRLMGAGPASVAGGMTQTSGGTSEIFNGSSTGGFFLINVSPPSEATVSMNGIVISNLGFRDPQHSAYGAINLHDTEYFAVDDVSCRAFYAGTCINLYGDSANAYTQFGSIKDIFTGTTLCGICTANATQAPPQPQGFVSEVTVLGGNISCVDPTSPNNGHYPLAGSVGISFNVDATMSGQKNGENQIFGASVNDCLTGYNLTSTGATHVVAKFEQTLTGNNAGTCPGSTPSGDIGCGTGLVIDNKDSSNFYANGNVLTFQSSKAGVGIQINETSGDEPPEKEQIAGGTFESNFTADVCVNPDSLPSTMVLVALAAAPNTCPSPATAPVTGSQFPTSVAVASLNGTTKMTSTWTAGPLTSGAPPTGLCTANSVGSLYTNTDTSATENHLFVCQYNGTSYVWVSH